MTSGLSSEPRAHDLQFSSLSSADIKSSHESEVFTNVYFRSQSKKKAFTKSCTKWADDLGKKEIEKDLAQVI